MKKGLTTSAPTTYNRDINKTKGDKQMLETFMDSIFLYGVMFIKVNFAIMWISFIILSLLIAHEDTLPADED